jgi:hypothetical protein
VEPLAVTVSTALSGSAKCEACKDIEIAVGTRVLYVQVLVDPACAQTPWLEVDIEWGMLTAKRLRSGAALSISGSRLMLSESTAIAAPVSAWSCNATTRGMRRAPRCRQGRLRDMLGVLFLFYGRLSMLSMAGAPDYCDSTQVAAYST